jgi:hypothetical protein
VNRCARGVLELNFVPRKTLEYTRSMLVILGRPAFSRFHLGYKFLLEIMSKRRNENKRSTGRRGRQSRPRPNWFGTSAQNAVQRIMLQGESTITSSGAGVVGNSIPFDPSSGGYSFAEYGSVSTLWSEIKFISCMIQIIPRGVLTQGDPLYIGYRFDTNSAPNAYTSVSNLPSLRIYNVVRDTSSRGFSMIAKSRGPLNWSQSGTPVTTQYAGCPGCFMIYGQGFSNSTVICTVRVRSVYAVRGRF